MGGVTLSYDPALRLSQTVGAATTKFLYDGDDAIAEYNGSNALQRRFIFDPTTGQPVLWYEGTGTAATNRRYLSQDERGSVISVSDSTSASLGLNSYDEYGKPGAANLGRHQYTGQKWIGEAGVYDYKARDYLPQLGIFAQTDPIGTDGGVNLYAYVEDDPVNLTDPSGLTYIIPGNGGAYVCDLTCVWQEEIVVVGQKLPGTRPDWQWRNQFERRRDTADWVRSTRRVLSGMGDTILVTGRQVQRTLNQLDNRLTGLTNIPFVVLHDLAFPPACGAGPNGEPCSLAEQLAIETARGNLSARRIMQGKINDPSYPENVWGKFQYVHHQLSGRNITVHFWRNLQTGAEERYKIVR